MSHFHFCSCPPGEIDCRFCVAALYLRDSRPPLPVEPPSSSHRGFAARRKRADRDPNLIFHWISEDGYPSPALARARVHVSANSN